MTNIRYGQDLKQHLNLRKAKIASVPTQITSRFEDQLAALKSRGYKERAVLYQFQLVLLRSREEVMEKVKEMARPFTFPVFKVSKSSLEFIR